MENSTPEQELNLSSSENHKKIIAHLKAANTYVDTPVPPESDQETKKHTVSAEEDVKWKLQI